MNYCAECKVIFHWELQIIQKLQNDIFTRIPTIILKYFICLLKIYITFGTNTVQI